MQRQALALSRLEDLAQESRPKARSVHARNRGLRAVELRDAGRVSMDDVAYRHGSGACLRFSLRWAHLYDTNAVLLYQLLNECPIGIIASVQCDEDRGPTGDLNA